MDMRFFRFVAIVVSLLSWAKLGNAQLLVDVDVDITQDSEGIYTYLYTISNSDFSNQSINAFQLSTGFGADVDLLEGPDGWGAFYDPGQRNLQAVWITGLNADGSDCGVSNEFDLNPGQSAEFTLVSPWEPGIASVDASISWIGLGCEIVGEELTTELLSPLTPPVQTGPPCDFDGDGDCDVLDIDSLNQTVVEGSNDIAFDLTSDSAVNRADVETFLIQVERLSGDLDLNGSVEFADFLVLSSNFGVEAPWSGGDLDSDGTVAFGDFLVLSPNFGQTFVGSNVSASPVPEPATGGLLALALLSMMSQRRRRFCAVAWNSSVLNHLGSVKIPVKYSRDP